MRLSAAHFVFTIQIKGMMSQYDLTEVQGDLRIGPSH